MNGPKKRLLIAGGGTGGHLFPALAVAEQWEKEGGEVLFVGTPQGLESRILPERGKSLALIRVGRYQGGGILGKLRTILGLPQALLHALRIVRRFQPDVVLGVGGYASAPAVVAARLLAIPTALHEQNALPGLTNRLLSRLASQIFISFEAARGHFSTARVLHTGNPVNHLFHQQPLKPAPRRGEPFHLLIFGGSLGAQVFGERIPPVLAALRQSGRALVVAHQVQANQQEQVQALYERCAMPATVQGFFDNMAERYQQADLVLCRAGATTVAELAALGKPALLIPYPYAADDHQTANAQAFAETGAGWMCPQEQMTPEWLTHFLTERLNQPETLTIAAAQARKLATPLAAQHIVEKLLALTQTNPDAAP